MIQEAEQGFISIDDLKDLEGMLSDMQLRASAAPLRLAVAPKRRSRSGGKRKPSAWNAFVSSEMPKVLKKHPRFTPQRAMKEVARRWRTSPKNPHRRKKR